MSLTPFESHLIYPSGPNSQRTRLFTSDSNRLRSFTSISGVLSVTMISPPFFLRLLNLYQNCWVDTIFILNVLFKLMWLPVLILSQFLLSVLFAYRRWSDLKCTIDFFFYQVLHDTPAVIFSFNTHSLLFVSDSSQQKWPESHYLT